MITNLPLLFVKGNPKSLYKMTVEELETFVPFLVHCSWGHDTVKNVEQPTWWPSNIPYSNPLVRPKMSTNEWVSQLRDIIKLCYKHHCSDFLLKFCEELAKNSPSSLLYVNNCDSTTSLYLKKTRRLLVTFRNENVLYDRKATRKCLLPQRQMSGSSVVESEAVNIYLCDTCDQTFESVEVLNDHENTCSKGSEGETIDLSRLSPEPETIESSDQRGFMRTLGLFDNTPGASNASPVKNDYQPHNPNGSRERRTLINGLTNFPFSSLAGQLNNKSRQHSYETIDRQREVMDRYCSAPPQSLDSLKWTKHTGRHFPVKYRKPEGHWMRTQTFPNQRRKLMLDIDSQLLYLKCKPCQVVIDKWTADDINVYNEKARNARLCEMERDSDNEIEFVSFTALEGSSVRKKQSEECFIEIEIPFDVIDLCSDDDDQNENVHPTPDPHHPPSESIALNPERSTEADSAQDSKNSASTVRESEQSKPKPLQQCHDNLCSSHITNVISID